ncbi:hypothetical protein B9K05_09620 [Acetobacter syzygii]|uniref:Uncharacterized protein n=1 Tax=Acetobacter syzygii TaxID=146476 RepID=A0A270BI19_9PROT|nr:hypothetical protein B9K05_09620 [Acetobacter syzygii]PAL24435.1 hypothetical protein B9K04_09115 [Acetobacter syzygii]
MQPSLREPWAWRAWCARAARGFLFRFLSISELKQAEPCIKSITKNVYFKGKKAGKTSHLERQYPYKWQKTAIHTFKVIHLFSAGVTARTNKVYHF